MNQKVKSVFVFPNGMVAVFGWDDQQIPELQGKWVENKYRILSAADKDTEWKGYKPDSIND